MATVARKPRQWKRKMSGPQYRPLEELFVGQDASKMRGGRFFSSKGKPSCPVCKGFSALSAVDEEKFNVAKTAKLHGFHPGEVWAFIFKFDRLANIEKVPPAEAFPLAVAWAKDNAEDENSEI